MRGVPSKKTEAIQPFVTIAFFLFLGIAFYYSHKREERLITNYKMAVGEIYGYKEYGIRSSGGELYFTFQAGDSTVKAYSREANIEKCNLKAFVGHRFYVIYDSTDLTNYDILITPQSFETYYFDFPDSLNWVRDL